MLKPDFLRQKPTAVLVIDMQPYFLQVVEEAQVRQAIEWQKRVLMTAVSQAVPVLFSEDAKTAKTGTIPELLKEVSDATVLQRYQFSAFEDGGALFAKLSALGIQHLFLMGAYTSQCVRASARSALMRGLSFATATEVVLPREPSDNRFALPWFVENGTIETLEPADT